MREGDGVEGGAVPGGLPDQDGLGLHGEGGHRGGECLRLLLLLLLLLFLLLLSVLLLLLCYCATATSDAVTLYAAINRTKEEMIKGSVGCNAQARYYENRGGRGD